jgi:transcriptional regulator with PAS, ATPase and Fis domain
MQAKLLRVLQDHEVVRVGSTQVKKVDVRIIAATNRNLEEAVKEGAFRSDLFYRLRVAVLNIPPLRDRTNDILPLARHFLGVFSNKYKKELTFTRETEAVLQRYNWPGNVRELENDIQGLVITCDGESIETEDLPRSMRGDPKISCPEDATALRVTNTDGKSLKEIMVEVETDILKNAIEFHGSVSEVARVFKVNRTTIFRKLNRKP